MVLTAGKKKVKKKVIAISNTLMRMGVKVEM